MSRLSDYHAKRDFDSSSEPRGAIAQEAGRTGLFVIQKHAASHLHFDLRLEFDGVLRSWALPKGPSLKPGAKRLAVELAVEVEDHPLDYADFEGTIAKQQYGGGTVMLWDRGHWHNVKPISDQRIDFELSGSRLAGRWTLARMNDDKHRNWLLIKRKPAAGASDITTVPGEGDTSVTTGRTMAEIAAGSPARRPAPGRLEPDPATLDGAARGRLPDAVKPLLATRGDRAPTGRCWLHEIKLDGYRLMAWIEAGHVRLTTRNGYDWRARFKPLGDVLERHIRRDVLLDGELVALDAGGISRFGMLQDAIAGEHIHRLVYQAFDLLHVDGIDLRGVALDDRKHALAALLVDAPAMLRFTDHVIGHGPAFFAQAQAAGLEGIISKRVDSRYRGGRQKSWRKTKTAADDTFVIGGYTEGEGQRAGGFGALLLGEVTNDGRLRYAGRVGSGFYDRVLDDLGARLADLRRDHSPFDKKVPEAGAAHWVKPCLLADIAFAERTGAGLLRQARFRGLREDLDPPQLNEDSMPSATRARQPIPTTRPGSDSARPTHLPRSETSARKNCVVEVAGVRLTHPDREVYTDPPISKQALAEYIAAVAHWMLPGLAARPLSLLRCPDGIAEACFFQKHPRGAVPDAIPRIELPENDPKRTGIYTYVKTVADLVGLIQAGAVEIHPWNARIDNVERPDRLVFDLDPGPGTEWTEILRVARALRERIEDLGLVPFVRLTGGRGLHLVVPIERRLDWTQAKTFARALCRVHARRDPAHTTVALAKSKRRGRMFLDYLRNARGATAIASYSPRARPGAGIAMNLRWDELAARRRSDHYDPKTALRRLAALRADPWAEFDDARRRVTQAMRAGVDLE